MGRTSIDKLPQRTLLERLRIDIARSMSGPRKAEAARRVDALVEDNPNSWASTYVAYNLGKRKFTWLWSRVAGTRPAAMPRRRDADTHSLAEIYRWIDQISG